MELSEYIRSVSSEGNRFASAVESGELDVSVPTCGDWDLRDLVRHLGLIHLWAAGNVAFPRDDWFDADDIPDLGRYWPELASEWPADDDLVSWYRATNDHLVRVLESAPLDHECFTFLPAPTPVTMWSRRQASEIAVHRFDAEHALGISSHFEPGFANDMLDELLSGFAPRPKPSDVASTRVLQVHATDVDASWFVTIGPGGVETSRDGDDADLVIAATAAELYLLMWNRTDAASTMLTGDRDVLDIWRDVCQVRWSGGG